MLIKNLSEEEKKKILKEALEFKNTQHIIDFNSAEIIRKSLEYHASINSEKKQEVQLDVEIGGVT